MFEDVFKVYGFGDEFLVDKFVFVQIVDEFFGFVGDVMMVIYNVSFDMKFINVEFGWVGKLVLLMLQVFDMFVIVWWKFFGLLVFLDVLCCRFGIDNLL